MNKSIVFMGTPDFAVPTMKAINEKFGIKAVVTIPDKPKGRGQKLMPSPVKTAALELGLELLQPITLKDEDFQKALIEIEPDIIVVVAFRILPKSVYSIAKIASFNIHGSLLPKYRGAAPINYAILNDEKISGVTSFILQDKVDTGNILLKKQVTIPENSTAGDLHNLLMPLSADCAVETIDLLIDGNFTPILQDDSLASPAPKIFKEHCKIDFNNSSDYLRRFINHISVQPGAYTYFNDKVFKILRADFSDLKIECGNYLIKEDGFFVGTTDFALKLNIIQVEGKNPISANEYTRGYRGEKYGIFK